MMLSHDFHLLHLCMHVFVVLIYINRNMRMRHEGMCKGCAKLSASAIIFLIAYLFRTETTPDYFFVIGLQVLQ